MMPKKGRRNITVDDTLYHYKVKGSISIVIQNTETNEIIKWNEDLKPKWGIPFKPSDIKDIINDHNKSEKESCECMGVACYCGYYS